MANKANSKVEEYKLPNPFEPVSINIAVDDETEHFAKIVVRPLELFIVKLFPNKFFSDFCLISPTSFTSLISFISIFFSSTIFSFLFSFCSV